MNQKRFVFRADASKRVGTGHIMRCLVLADALKLRGYQTIFACQPLVGHLNEYIEKRGHQVVELCNFSTPAVAVKNDGYERWLQRTQIEDAEDFLKHIVSSDVVITDHYAIGFVWHRAVKAKLGCRIIAIDDLVRQHDADIIIDQTLGRETQEYANCPEVLAGTRYAILAPMYSVAREHALDKSYPQSPLRILVSMGGVDEPNATQKVLEVLVKRKDIKITVVLSPRAPNYASVQHLCTQNDINHIDFTENMAGLMLEHDIAIGAPGTTSWERACLGLPTVLVPLAENQETNCKMLVSRGAAEAISINDIALQMNETLEKIKHGWEIYRIASLKVCDGLGVKRIVREIDNLIDKPTNGDVNLRRAVDSDISIVYEWQCLPETRKYALNTETPTRSQHIKWMKHKLECVEDYFYIITNSSSQESFGVVRLDRISLNNYLISIFISPKYHGNGIAGKALKAIDFLHSNINIHATVLEKNNASQRLFEKSGYERCTNEKFIRKTLD